MKELQTILLSFRCITRKPSIAKVGKGALISLEAAQRCGCQGGRKSPVASSSQLGREKREGNEKGRLPPPPSELRGGGKGSGGAGHDQHRGPPAALPGQARQPAFLRGLGDANRSWPPLIGSRRDPADGALLAGWSAGRPASLLLLRPHPTYCCIRGRRSA